MDAAIGDTKGFRVGGVCDRERGCLRTVAGAGTCYGRPRQFAGRNFFDHS
jgi:hypothetical protein